MSVNENQDVKPEAQPELTEQDVCKELAQQATPEVVAKATEQVVKAVSERLLRRGKAPAVAKDDSDKSFNDWLHLVGKAASPNHAVREKAYNELSNKYYEADKGNLNQGTTTAGGFTVPNMYSADLLGLQDYGTVAFDRVQRYDIAGMATQYIPVRDQTGTPSTGDSAFLAGVTVGVVSEGNAPASTTQPAFKQLALTAQKYSAEIDVTLELVQNSLIDITGLINELGRDVLVQRVEYGIFNGDGSYMTGIIGAGGTLSLTRATANEVGWDDVKKMYTRFHGNLQRAVWVCGPLVYEQLLGMADANGNLIWVPNMSNFASVAMAPLPTILGIPVVKSQYTPSLGTTGDLLLCDFNAFALGVNREITIAASEHFKFNQQIITYLATMRVGGKNKYTAPVTLADGTTKVSPLIQLSASTS